MSLKESIESILAEGSEAFAKLRSIKSWSLSSIYENLGTIIEAVNDGFSAIAGLREKLGEWVNDEEAQEELAQVLDDAIKLNAILETIDGTIFKLIIKTICAAIAPYITTTESSDSGEAES